ncbi:MAG: ammonia channel protein, partial [Paracoccaceae bacterium]
IVGVFTFVLTVLLVKIVGTATGLRVDAETETNGLDLSVHGERAYDMNS